MKHKRNRGFSLVELLVAVAVLSIVTLGVGGLLRLAAEQYSNATKETEVQNLLQSTFASISNSLEDVMIDVNFSENKLTIINRDGCILYEKKGDKIYYDEKTLTDLGITDANPDDSTIVTNALAATTGSGVANELADHVQSFSVDTSTKDQGFVVLSITITYRDRSKNLIQNVFMRNLRPKNAVVAQNVTTTVVTTVVTTEITQPLGDPNATTPPPPPVMAAADIHDYTNSETHLKEMTFTIKKTQTGFDTVSAGLKVTLNENNEYVLSGLGDTARALLGSEQVNGEGKIPAMPNMPASGNNFVLNDSQLDWLKNNYSVDVKDTLPIVVSTSHEYPYTSVNPHMTEQVYEGDVTKTTVSKGNSLGWGSGGPYPITITTEQPNATIYSVRIKVENGSNIGINSNNQYWDYRYKFKAVEGQPGVFDIYYDYTDENNYPIQTIVPCVAAEGNFTVTILSIDICK